MWNRFNQCFHVYNSSVWTSSFLLSDSSELVRDLSHAHSLTCVASDCLRNICSSPERSQNTEQFPVSVWNKANRVSQVWKLLTLFTVRPADSVRGPAGLSLSGVDGGFGPWGNGQTGSPTASHKLSFFSALKQTLQEPLNQVKPLYYPHCALFFFCPFWRQH